ncbi:MAG: DUF4190 domain-containing protein [Actinomycetota bacterium]
MTGEWGRPHEGGPPPPVAPGYGQPRTNGLAVASMIFGIASLALGVFCYFGILSGPAAIVMGLVARRQIGRSQGTETGAGMALAGIILGAVAVVAVVAFVVLVFTDASEVTPKPA